MEEFDLERCKTPTFTKSFVVASLFGFFLSLNGSCKERCIDVWLDVYPHITEDVREKKNKKMQ